MKKRILFGLLGGVLFFNGLFIGEQGMSKTIAKENLFSMREILTPIWEGEISYQESVLPVKDENGGVQPIKLLYPIEEILEVKNAALTVTYEYGTDYLVLDGSLLINPKGKIPMLSYEEMHPTSGKSGYESRDGGKILHQEGSWFHSRQIVVTYRHTAEYTGHIPERQAELLENIREKLLNKEEINLFVLGDSISVGANSSGFKDVNVSPYMPIYPELFAEGLKQTYGVENINIVNASVGGTGSSWGVNTVTEALKNCEDIDLAILAFGMNDTCMEPVDLAGNMNRMAVSVQMKFPQADILMIATMLPNYDAVNFYGNQERFYEAMKEDCERESVAIVNMTGIHKALLERKSYADMTGNNVNHPNDYLARVYAQTLLETLKEKETEHPQHSESNRGGKGCNSSVSSIGAVTIGLSAIALSVKEKRKNKRRF